MQITVKDHAFESAHTDAEAAARLIELTLNRKIESSFGQSLCMSAQRGKLSVNQMPWVHVLVAQAEGVATKPGTTTTVNTVAGFEKIHAHLTNCRKSKANGGKGLLHPVVTLLVGDEQVTLKLAGERSKHYGKLAVSESHRYGEGRFFGWIDEKGVFDVGARPMVIAVLKILQRVAADPAKVISEIGRESGHCCYCHTPLSQVGSKIAGCGSTCATNYGADYPKAAQIRAYIAKYPEILEGASDAEKWATPVGAC